MDLRENGHFTDCTCRECRLEAERDALRAQLAAADIAQEKNEGCGEIADIEEAATKTGPYRAAGRFVRDASGVLITKCASRATALMIEACLNDDQATTTRRACAAELRDKAEKLRKRTADTGAWEWAARLLEGYADRWEGRALSRSLAAGPAQPSEEEK